MLLIKNNYQLNKKIRGFLETVIDNFFLPNCTVKQDKDIFIYDLTHNIYKYDFIAHTDKFKDKKLNFFTGINDSVCPIEDHLIPFYRKLKELDHKNLDVSIEICDQGLNCETPITIAEVLTKFIK